MTSIFFGDNENFAKVVYDRKAGLCVLLCNSVIHFPDALALVRTLQADQTIIIAPVGLQELFQELTPMVELTIYEL